MSHLLSRRHRLGRAWLCLALLLSLLALATDVHTQPPPGKPPTGNVALPATAPPGKPGVALKGDCSSEGGLASRTDLVLCEPWEVDTWWQLGYQADGTKTVDRPADAANAMYRASLTSTNCVSGKCLKLDMLRARPALWPCTGRLRTRDSLRRKSTFGTT